ncbi:hypothetical protein [Rodentibacter pneumotropicus]|uniref:hypothetical protein n=1 Tax=Rodentibacter pneumotropicus TaxID=758 RepID=UPI0009877C74|nr:hypothetical protein [Rodentibacter pneumotropicus]OOF62055.1 hypothetical protein BKL50_06665 [Rodentibacter pneumotropicus]THA18294.1 hypothetical protein D3M83_06100 [Rodentibacter pneumotropicus]
MLTVKIIQDGMTHIYETDKFTFHGKDSEQFNFLLECIGKLDIQPNELTEIYYTQPLFKDEQCTEIAREEEILFSRRITQGSNELNGVICRVVAENGEFDGDIYEDPYTLISKDDRVYVTNELGKTVFSI